MAAGNRGRSAALHAPPDKRSAARRSETLSTVVGCATRKGVRFWKLCEVYYSQSSLQFVGMFRSECNAHAFSAAVPTRISERQTARLSSALPGQRKAAVSLVRRIGTDSASGRPSVSGVSVANAVDRAFCAV